MVVGDGEILHGALNRFRAAVRKGLANETIQIGETLNMKLLGLTEDEVPRVVITLAGYVSSEAGGSYPHLFKFIQSEDGNDLIVVPHPTI
jgi:hypothetical protein